MRIQGSPDVGVVARAVMGDGLDRFPASGSFSFPQDDLASSTLFLWSRCCGGDQAPGLSSLDNETSHVVVVPGRCNILHGPGTVSPMSHSPGARASVWTGLVMIADEVEDDGLPFVIHREILEIDPTALCLIILDAGRMAEIG